jgi:transposase
MPAPTPVLVNDTQRQELERIAKAPTSHQRMVLRANIILGLANGGLAQEVATDLGASRVAVSRWRRRWAAAGLAGLQDAPGRGRKPYLPPREVGRTLSLAATPAPDGGPWSVRRMARETGLSKSTVQRLWSAHGLKPHRQRRFKLSLDSQFEEKYWDVVGLYLDPPQNAVVLCCDEKSQCQALERTQPGLPLGQGHLRTQTHDYYRHGTITLFAALNYLSGKVLAHTARRHRHGQWLAFLRKIETAVPAGQDIHLICDNYATHKHARVRAWLQRHPRFQVHFTPTSASWLNLVERFFGEITRRVIRSGSFRSVPELVAQIFRFLDQHNLKPKRFAWTADPNAVLDKIHRAWDALLEQLYNPISGTAH